MSLAPEFGVRMADVLGGLSLASDVVNGFPPGKVLRTAVLAVTLGRFAGEPDDTLRDTLYTTLLRYLGCTGFAHEEAHLYGGGDDITLRNVMSMADPADPVTTLSAITRRIAAHESPLVRVTAVGRLLDPRVVERHARSQCETSIRLAELVGASERVREALRFVCERWDGRGAPDAAEGDAIEIATRLFHVADVAEVAHHRSGRDAARAMVRRRAGKHLDPRLARVFEKNREALLDTIEGATLWDRFLACEPTPVSRVDDDGLDDVARALAHFADLKSVYTLGHSSGVAALSRSAGEQLGMPPSELRELGRAALLHDIGRIAIPNGIWDRPGKLGFAELERVRLHAYYSERILSQSPAMRSLAQLASAAHERIDGSGYHRGLPGPACARAARVLAAADAAHAMSEERPHRKALSSAEIEREIVNDQRAGRLDRDAVEAVLAASGVRPSLQPTGLSDREIEVLRWVARGKTNKEIGTLLGISPRTVQNHVAHVYDKLGIYSRAGAALYVMERGLL